MHAGAAIEGQLGVSRPYSLRLKLAGPQRLRACGLVVGPRAYQTLGLNSKVSRLYLSFNELLRDEGGVVFIVHFFVVSDLDLVNESLQYSSERGDINI